MPDKPTEDRFSARELILTLIDSTAATSLSASYFVAAGQLFDMDPGSIRVALARLLRDGSLAGEERGHYRLGSRAGTLNTLVRNWSKSEQSLVPWKGGWLSILVGHLARTNRSRVRANERALRLYGFAEAGSGIWIRPDNLRQGLAEIHGALIHLGLDERSLCARIDAFEPAGFIQPAALWNLDMLHTRYRDNIARLATSSNGLAELSDAAAARETLLLGRRVTRDILLDPLLPDELVDAELRRQMVAAMHDYDRLGKSYWRAFFRAHQSGNAQKPAA